MNSILTQHFMSMKRDIECEQKLIASNQDSIINILNDTIPSWEYEITNIITSDSQLILTVVLYLPGRILSGIGKSVTDAIMNIINMHFVSKSNVNQSVQPTQVNQPLTNASQVVEKLQNIKNNVIEQNNQPKNNPSNSNNIFDDLLSDNNNVQNNQFEFGSNEAKEFEKEVGTFEQENKMPEQPTAEMVNPTNQLIPKNAWTVEKGAKLREWMQRHNVSNKDQMNAWLKKYCGLEYDYFDPQWLDKFIEWTDALREMQTY